MFSATRTFSKKTISGPVGWSAIGTSADWGVGSLSDDGSKLILANKSQNPGPAEYSTNSGSTFTASTIPSPRAAFTGLAMARNHSIGFLSTSGSYIFKTVNGGANWSLKSTTASRPVIACDSTGAKVVTAVQAGNISTSTDAGESWTARAIPGVTAGFNDWQCLGMSGDGNVIAAVSPRGGTAKYLNASYDGGATWPTQLNLTTAGGNFNSISLSSNGSIMMMTNTALGIWISTNSGSNWATDNSVPASGWISGAMSSDGTVKIACNTNGNVYIKRGSGAWAIETALGNRAWKHVSCSSDGKKILAVSSLGSAYKNY